MSIGLEDLFCAGCRSYVHVFLDRCPACGMARASRYAPDLDGGAIAPSTSSPKILDAAGIAMRRNMLTSRGRGLGNVEVEVDPELGLDVADLFSRIVGVITYKTVGTAEQHTTSDNVRLRAADGQLHLEEAGKHGVIASIALSHVLSATAVGRAGRGLPKWVGVTTGRSAAGRRPAGPLSDMLVLFATETGVAELGIGNRGGLLAARARPDHYEEVVRWLGVVAALEAGRRAEEIGMEPYLAELGLAPAGEPRAPESRRAEHPADAHLPEPGGGALAAGATPSVAAALRELEELRNGGLVTQAEYERKRRDVLDRL